MKAVITTNRGVITVELNQEKAPLTVANFKDYVEKGYYTGLIFHRVIPGFVIQGGGFTADMEQRKTEDPIKCESKNGLKNERGSIAMARTPNPHSATSQFFINVKDNVFLNYPGQDGWGYCVFGNVTSGMDVVDAIASESTTVKKGHRDVPITPIVIDSIEVIEQ